jgi:hypothetical protein
MLADMLTTIQVIFQKHIVPTYPQWPIIDTIVTSEGLVSEQGGISHRCHFRRAQRAAPAH